MKTIRIKLDCINILFFFSTLAQAQSVYITDQLKAGLYEEKTLDSPIVKIVPSGTSLELIKQEEELSFVRDPKGVTGWIDNKYLVQERPAHTQLNEVKAKNAQLKKQLAVAKQKINIVENELKQQDPPAQPSAMKTLINEKTALQHTIKKERLKVGELQVQLAEVRNRIGQNNDNTSLYKQIGKLEDENKNLEVQLAKKIDNNPNLSTEKITEEKNNSLANLRNQLISSKDGPVDTYLTLGLRFMKKIYPE